MASIVKRHNRYCVVYNYVDEHGVRKQKWETYKTKADAEKRYRDIEHATKNGTFAVRPCETFEELTREYIEIYGKNHWALSTYHRNIALMENYVLPALGQIKLSDFTSRMIEQYYRSLLDTDVVQPIRYGQRCEIPTGKKVTLEGVLDLLVDACCSRREYIRVAGDENGCHKASGRKNRFTGRRLYPGSHAGYSWNSGRKSACGTRRGEHQGLIGQYKSAASKAYREEG